LIGPAEQRFAVSGTGPYTAPMDLLAAFTALLGPGGFIADDAAMAPYLLDWRKLYQGKAIGVARPRDTAELAATVRLAGDAGIAMVPQSGNTGLVGGGVPLAGGRSLVISLERMNRVRNIDPANYTITVEAGCILQHVQQAAEAADRLFPLSLTAEGSCRIGGNLSTNAGGIAVLHYGNMRDLVLGLEVVLPDGQVWDGLRALRKDNTGYDLKHLFIGAEGTLGIISAAVLKLFPRPRERITAFAAAADLPATLALLDRLRAASGDALTSFEYIPRISLALAFEYVNGSFDPFAKPHDHYLLIELSSSSEGSGLRAVAEAALARAMEDGLLLDATIAESEAQAKKLWFLREAIVEAQRPAGAGIKHDVAVPIAAVPDFLSEAGAAVSARLPGVRVLAFGHLGDGNIHFNLCQPREMVAADFLAMTGEFNRLVHDIVARYAGSISAEHGIGQLRREEIRRYKPPVELDLMAKVKAALDPKGLMNPGKVI
jgi:FAD/FMN-containing dehydrogenase